MQTARQQKPWFGQRYRRSAWHPLSWQGWAVVALLMLGAGIGASYGPPPGQQPWWYVITGIIVVTSLIAFAARHVRRYEASEDADDSAHDRVVNPRH